MQTAFARKILVLGKTTQKIPRIQIQTNSISYKLRVKSLNKANRELWVASVVYECCLRYDG